jgi:hypothetical protein
MSGATGSQMTLFGKSEALSADGNTLLVGAPNDSGVGSAYVFTKTSSGNWAQQGNKLVGTGAANGVAWQGISVALSADGSTALVGGFLDNQGSTCGYGAVWVFTRQSGIWSQQGSKLVGSGAVNDSSCGGAGQGASVALSADGDTAVWSGPYDNNNTGAAWVFTRSNGIWTQQGAKLVGTGVVGTAFQGAVAISADGNTFVMGGSGDNSNVGAAWIFTRSNGVWTQQGPKLVGEAASGAAQQGFSVSISGDGTTILMGGTQDANQTGAVWVFTRSNGTWTQQGSKLVGTGALGAANQGASVALSDDGNTAIVGGFNDNDAVGASWLFSRGSDGQWTQLGSKLVGSGAVGASDQGTSVAMARDGNTAVIGGYFDDNGMGAVWVFTRIAFVGNGIGGYDLASTADRAFAFDYNGSGYLDHIVLYRPGTGVVWIVQKNVDGTFASVYQSSFDFATGYGNGIGGYDLRSASDRMFAFDYNGSGKQDHLVLYRPGTGIVWILANNGGTFTPVYQSTFNASTGFGEGIGGYDLRSPSDQLLAFDFTGGNTANFLLAYRPGTGIAWILSRAGNSFAPVFQSTYDTSTGFGGGIGGYDLRSTLDQISAGSSTYTLGSGNSGQLFIYRPGAGIIWILRSNGNGTFTSEYQSSFDASTGLGAGFGAYDLQSTSDRVVLASTPGSSNGYGLIYRPGTGIAWTVQCTTNGGLLSACAPVYQSSFNASTGLGGGIGGYDLLSTSDRAFAFDYSDSGALDHVVLYRPGAGMFWILENNGNSFSAVYR